MFSKRSRIISSIVVSIVFVEMTTVRTALAKSADETCRTAIGTADELITACGKAIQQNPKDPILYRLRATEWHRRGNDELSQNNYEKAKSHYTKAISDYSEAIKLDPKFGVAYYNRGDAWHGSRDYDKAIADYSEAISLLPRQPLFYQSRGQALSARGDYDKADADFGEFFKWFPSPSVHVLRGRNWSEKGDHEKAIAAFDQAISADYKEAFYYRGLEWEKKKDFQKSLSDFRRFAELEPSDSRGIIAISRLEDKMKTQPAQGVPQIAQPVNPQVSAPVQSVQPTVIIPPQDRRVALVIGNTKYQHVSALQNPVNDAQLLASILKSVGFQSVTLKNDLTREQIVQALREFAQLADSADWAVVYYSGHGVEFGGVNYMIPVDAQLKVDRDIDLETVDVGKVLSSIEGAKRLRLVILDACRDNPFASQMRRSIASRSLGRGLARIEPDAGTLIVYAAKNGETALDGNGKNSPFVESLARRMQEKPPKDIRRMFDNVRDDVLKSTQRKQQPFSYGSLPGDEDFYFLR